MIDEADIKLNLGSCDESGQVRTEARCQAKTFRIEHGEQRQPLVSIFLELKPLLQHPARIADVAESLAELSQGRGLDIAFFNNFPQIEEFLRRSLQTVIDPERPHTIGTRLGLYMSCVLLRLPLTLS